MRDDRVMRILKPSLALTALAILLIVLGGAIVGPAHAATSAPAGSDGAVVLQRGDEVRFGEDAVVLAGTTVPTAVAFGGDILVDGTVTDAVVAFGGDIVVNGTVGREIVAFGGDVTLGPKAIAGSSLSPDEASLVLFGGTLTQDPGAQVVGQTNSFSGVGWSKALSWAAGLLVVNPFWGMSLVGWIVQTAFFLVLALVAAALMPNQLRSVQRHLGRKPWASLGWGALMFFIVGPAVMIVLVISIIGLLLVLPYGLFVLLAYFFVTTGVAAYLAQRVILGFGGKENLMLAVTLGVVGTTVLSRIPVAGPLLVAGMMVFGTGAAALGIAEWRRVRRQEVANAAAALPPARRRIRRRRSLPRSRPPPARLWRPPRRRRRSRPRHRRRKAARRSPRWVRLSSRRARLSRSPRRLRRRRSRRPARRPGRRSRRRPSPARRRRHLRTHPRRWAKLRRTRPMRLSQERRRRDPARRVSRRRDVPRSPGGGPRFGRTSPRGIQRATNVVGRAGRRGPPPAVISGGQTQGGALSEHTETETPAAIIAGSAAATATCEAGTTVGLEDAVVQGRDLSREYGQGDALVRALTGVSIDLQRGAYTAIMGPSGSGKSTLMHILAGLDKPTSGNVWIDGQEITTLKERALTQLRRDKIGFIFQTFNLLPTLNAQENIMLPLTIAGRKGDEAWVKELIDTVGLADRLTHKPSELSGGQQQRVAVARALASRPAVLFADEPTGNLDSRTGEEVLQLLRGSRDELGQTIVMVTHDAHAATFADRIVFLKDGHIAHDCGRLGRDDIYEVIKSLEGAG